MLKQTPLAFKHCDKTMDTQLSGSIKKVRLSNMQLTQRWEWNIINTSVSRKQMKMKAHSKQNDSAITKFANQIT